MKAFREDVEFNPVNSESGYGDSVLIQNAIFGSSDDYRLVHTDPMVLSDGRKAWVETFLATTPYNYAISEFKIVSVNKLHNGTPYLHRIYYYPDIKSDRYFVCGIDTESYNDLKSRFKDSSNLKLRQPMVPADVQTMKDNGLSVDEEFLKEKGILLESKRLKEDIELIGHGTFEDMNTILLMNSLGIFKHSFIYEGTKIFELSSGHKAYVEEFRDDCSLFKLITILNCRVYNPLMKKDTIVTYNHRIYYYPIYHSHESEPKGECFWCSIDKESYNDIKNIFEDCHNIELRCLDKSDDSTIRKLKKFGVKIDKKDLKDENPVVIDLNPKKNSEEPLEYTEKVPEKEKLDETIFVYQYFKECKYPVSRLTEEQFQHWKLFKKWVKDNYTDVKFLKDSETKKENCEITCKKGSKDISFYYDGLDGFAYITINKNDKVPESFKELMRSFHWWDTGDSWIEDDDETKKTYCFTNGNRYDESKDKLEISKEFKKELKKAFENVDSESPDYAYVEKTLNALWDIWEKSSFYDVLKNSLDKGTVNDRFMTQFPDKDVSELDDYVDCIKDDISLEYLSKWLKKNNLSSSSVSFWGPMSDYFQSDSKFITKRPNFKKFYDGRREWVERTLFRDFEKKEANSICVGFDDAIGNSDKDKLLGLLDRMYSLWREYLDSLDEIDRNSLPPKSELDSELYWKLREWGIDLKHYDLVCGYFNARGFEKEKKSFNAESFINKILKD